MLLCANGGRRVFYGKTFLEYAWNCAGLITVGVLNHSESFELAPFRSILLSRI